MGRPRLGTYLKKPSDYKYDYPEIRDYGLLLTPEDKNIIVEKTGYSYAYVHAVCKGERKNPIIHEWILRIAQINIEKQQKLNSLSN